MLRAPRACSSLSDITKGRFQPLISDEPQYDGAKRLLIGSGKIVHELRAEREKRATSEVAIVALEELYPLPEKDILNTFRKYKNLNSTVWVQEEPANMGALFYVRPHLDRLSGDVKLTSVRRSASASPATGSPKAHALEQQALITLAFADF